MAPPQTDGWRSIAESFVARIGATLTPVALFSIGLNFNLRMSRERLGAASLALGWKLAIAPALIFALALAVGAKGLVFAVAVLQAGMAPMASVSILCQQYNLETEVANAALGVGLAISLVTVPFINTLLPLSVPALRRRLARERRGLRGDLRALLDEVVQILDVVLLLAGRRGPLLHRFEQLRRKLPIDREQIEIRLLRVLGAIEREIGFAAIFRRLRIAHAQLDRLVVGGERGLVVPELAARIAEPVPGLRQIRVGFRRRGELRRGLSRTRLSQPPAVCPRDSPGRRVRLFHRREARIEGRLRFGVVAADRLSARRLSAARRKRPTGCRTSARPTANAATFNLELRIRIT